MRRPVSDAIVFFGATGDLAYKQIFPALQGLIRDEGLDIPITGVAKAGWSLDQLKARAKDSLSSHGGLDTEAFAKLTSLLRYVDGDYSDPSTYVRLRQELKEASRPLHYLAIPPSLFATVAEGLRAKRAPPRSASRSFPNLNKKSAAGVVTLLKIERCPYRKLCPTSAKSRIGRCSVSWGICSN